MFFAQIYCRKRWFVPNITGIFPHLGAELSFFFEFRGFFCATPHTSRSISGARAGTKKDPASAWQYYHTDSWSRDKNDTGDWFTTEQISNYNNITGHLKSNFFNNCSMLGLLKLCSSGKKQPFFKKRPWLTFTIHWYSAAPKLRAYFQKMVPMQQSHPKLTWWIYNKLDLMITFTVLWKPMQLHGTMFLHYIYIYT